MSETDNSIPAEAVCDFVECNRPQAYAVVRNAGSPGQEFLGFYCQEHAIDMTDFFRAIMENSTIRIITLEGESRWPTM